MNTEEEILERDKTFWIATLPREDGSTYEIWQKIHLEQDNPDFSSWSALKKSRPKIKGFRVRFRSHTERLPDNMEGYYFNRGIIGDPGSGDSADCYIMGYVENGLLHKIWYRVPELLVWMEETVPITFEEERLIMNSI